METNEPYRVTLSLDEETHARYQQAASRLGLSLDGWIGEYLDAASDPDAGQVVDLARRLASVEQERDRLERIREMMAQDRADAEADLIAAEARVEALDGLCEFAIGALRSNQDTLLHKVPRTPVVAEQLTTNLAALRHLGARAAPSAGRKRTNE